MKNCLKADAKASAFEFLSIKISSVIKISKGRICRKHQNSINIKILKASRNLGTGYSCKANCKNGFRMRISRRWRFTEKVPQTQCLSGFAGFLHWLQNRVPNESPVAFALGRNATPEAVVRVGGGFFGTPFVEAERWICNNGVELHKPVACF